MCVGGGGGGSPSVDAEDGEVRVVSVAAPPDAADPLPDGGLGGRARTPPPAAARSSPFAYWPTPVFHILFRRLGAVGKAPRCRLEHVEARS